MEKASPKERKIGLLLFLLVAGGFGTLYLCECTFGFDVGRLFNPCGFRQRTHLPCVTCGWTSATRAFVRGDLEQALYLQPAATFVDVTLVLASLMGLFVTATARIPRVVVHLYRDLRWWQILTAFGITLAAGWAVTLVRALSQRGG